MLRLVPSASLPKSSVHTFFLIAVVYLFRSVFCEAACYLPDGSLQQDDVPCNPSAKASVCCGRGWTCLSNAICMLNQDSKLVTQDSRIGATYRTSCTDKSWSSPECPNFCKESPSEAGVYQSLSSCGKRTWCCQGMSSNSTYCCNDGSEILHLKEVTENAIQIPLSPTVTVSSSPVGASATSSSPNAATTPASPTAIPPSTHSKLRTIALGIGIGLVLPLTLIAMACFLFFLRKRRARELPPHAIAVKAKDDHAQMSDFNMLEGSEHRKFELDTRPHDHAQMSDFNMLEGCKHRKFELDTRPRSPAVEMSGYTPA